MKSVMLRLQPTLFFLLLLVSTTALDAQKIIHDRDAEERKPGDFHSIDVAHAIDLHLSQGGENVVVVSAPGAEQRARIRTEVRGGVLRIWYDNKKWYNSSGKITAYVAVRSLKMLKASGACNIIVSGELKGEELSIKLDGASDFKGVVNYGSVKIDQSGASDVALRGRVANLSINASGASRFKGYDAQIDNCVVDASGASDIRLTVNKVLNAQASGATNIHYRGEGVISDIKTSGASTIRKG